MIDETSEVEEPAWRGDQRRNLHRSGWLEPSSRSGICTSWKAIRHHQNQERETTMYRSVNAVSKATRPALKRYEWILIEK